jgi:ubiquinone/menaquinone biosynthesis C-methylase UbiE
LSNVRYDLVDRAEDFDAVRDRRGDAIDVWVQEVAGHLPDDGVELLLDVGSGTGIWSRALADAFGARVLGIEPSAGMRARAVQARRHPSVTYVEGYVDDLPVEDESADGAWMSTVIHQFPDMGAAARELRRVLRPGAPVLIRGGYPGRQQEIQHFHLFPSALALAERWPRLGYVISCFEDAGFATEALTRVREPTFDSYEEMLELLPIMRRSDTALVDIDDEEWAKGLAAIERAIAAGEAPPPMGQDLLVFR